MREKMEFALELKDTYKVKLIDRLENVKIEGIVEWVMRSGLIGTQESVEHLLDSISIQILNETKRYVLSGSYNKRFTIFYFLDATRTK